MEKHTKVQSQVEIEMEIEIGKALDVLKSGGVILYPTETIWGLGCDATNEAAVAKIYAIKKRAEEKSMIILLDNSDNAVKYVAEVPDIAWQLWEVSDKPLTLILPEARSVAKNLIPTQKTIAIRITSNEFCKKLIRKMNRPLVSTSANISGQPTPIKFDQISDEIKSAVDHIVNPDMSVGASGKSSSIIMIDKSNVVKIIRD